MTDRKISDLPSAGTVASTDKLVIVDVSDTSEAASGTTKSALVSQIAASVGGTPTGTGIPHIVAGVQDAAASLIVNADVNAAAAIAYSKLALAASIVNAD